MAVPVVRRRNAPVWDPFESLRQWSQAIDRTWEEFPEAREGGFWTPLADIEETDGAWLLELELPGVDKADVSVEVHGRQVSVSGERKDKERTGVLRRQTRIAGRFLYQVTLGTDIDPNGIEASMSDGVLTVRVPKHEEAQPRRIEIH